MYCTYSNPQNLGLDSWAYKNLECVASASSYPVNFATASAAALSDSTFQIWVGLGIIIFLLAANLGLWIYNR